MDTHRHDFRTQRLGTFTPWASIPVSNLMRTKQIACGDLSHDGRDDVAMAARGDLGQVEDTHRQGASRGEWPASRGHPPTRLAGRVEGRVVDTHRHDFRTQRLGNFTPWASIPVSNLMRTKQIACGDLSHDGRDDVAMAARGDLGSYPCTTFATAKGFAFQTPFLVSGGGINAIALGDLDCDGDLDAAFADDHGNGVLMAENDGMGALSNAMTMPAGLAVVAVATGDLDANGASDVLVAGTESNSLTALLLTCDRQGVPGDLDGDGVVGPADLASLLGSWGEAGPSDLDGDGTTGPSDLAIMLGLWS